MYLSPFVPKINLSPFVDVDDLHLIRKAVYFNHPLGDERFVEEVENRSGIKVGYAGYGRPGKLVTK